MVPPMFKKKAEQIAQKEIATISTKKRRTQKFHSKYTILFHEVKIAVGYLKISAKNLFIPIFDA